MTRLNGIAVLLAGTLLCCGAALGQPVSGLYVGAGVGANFMQDQPTKYVINAGVPTSQFRSFSFGTGVAGVVNVGWGFGNGLRVELEGNYRQNDIASVRGADRAGGIERKYGAMGNVLYDFDFGWPVAPFVGLGVGEQTVEWRNGQVAGPNYFIRNQHPDIVFAYQAILGLSYPLPVPGLTATAEYRFLGVKSGHTIYGQYFAPGLAKPSETRLTEDFNHSIMLGVRYAFSRAPAADAFPDVVPAPAAAMRSYLVFFDWDRATLNDRTRQVLSQAAQASTRVAMTRIDVAGHADASGSPQYNQGLSLRRARAVAEELVRLGVPGGAITAQGFGDTRPLVATAPGVREPQNRRVEIVLR